MTIKHPTASERPMSDHAQIHEVKCLSQYFDAIERGDKTFEVRRDDRGYQRGDILELWKYDGTSYVADDPITGGYHTCLRRISYVLTGGQFGIEPGYVVLALQSVEGE